MTEDNPSPTAHDQSSIIHHPSSISLSPPLTFSFSAAGWMKCYCFGAAQAIRHRNLHFGSKFIGSSAGALAAAALVLDIDLDIVKHHALAARDDYTTSLWNLFSIRKYVEATILSLAPAKIFHDTTQELNQRLVVSITELPFCQNRLISTFPSYTYFFQSLLASCNIVPLTGFPFWFERAWVVDGGLSNFQPIFDDHTICISCFYFSPESHRIIKPSLFVPPHWGLYPPSRGELERLYALGYHDMMTWIEKNIGMDDDEKMRTEQCALSSLHTKVNSFPAKISHKSPSHISKPITATSVLLDFLIVLLIAGFLKPIAFLLVYVELYIRTTVTIFKFCCHDILPTFSNRTRQHSWTTLCKHLRCLWSMRLLVASMPFVGSFLPWYVRKVKVNEARYAEASFVFRVFRHAIV